MADIEEVKKVRKMLKTNLKVAYDTTNKREISIRCPYCGDSKNATHAHLYVEMKPPFKFHCKKCETAGVLNTQTLRDLKIFSSDIASSIMQANKTIKKKDGAKFNVQRAKTKLNTIENDYVQPIVDYFNGRFDSNYNYVELVNKFKVIANSRQFVDENNIYVPMNKGGYPIYDFDRSIGFLSSDRSHAIYRDITNTNNRRYFNFNLYNSDGSTANKLYNITSGIDIMKDEITLVITEGIFDIIGVYEAFYKDNDIDNDHIFAAAAGKGYNAVISHYIRMGFLNMKVIIYSDNDVDVNFFKYLKQNSVYLKNSKLTIYYNRLDKDFGVSKDKIQLRRVMV